MLATTTRKAFAPTSNMHRGACAPLTPHLPHHLSLNRVSSMEGAIQAQMHRAASMAQAWESQVDAWTHSHSKNSDWSSRCGRGGLSWGGGVSEGRSSAQGGSRVLG